MSKRVVKAEIIKTEELVERSTEFQKGKNYFQNGDDDDYPLKQSLLASNSVTANQAVDLTAEAIVGRGVDETTNQTVINVKKQTTFYEFVIQGAKQLALQRGIFVWVGYNANFEQTEHEVLIFDHCRVGKTDSEDYSGFILYNRDWNKKNDTVEFHAYNPDIRAIKSQVRAAGGWKKYKGQIAYLNLDSLLVYPFSRINAVQLDCDSEFAASIHKNKQIRNGFFPKTFLFTKPLIDSTIPTHLTNDEGQLIDNPEYKVAASERSQFIQTAKEFTGPENAGGLMVVELEFNGDKMEEAVKIENVASSIDDKQTEYTETSARENICIAFNNLPQVLVVTPETMFGQTASGLIAARALHWNNCRLDRENYESFLNKLFSRGAQLKKPEKGFIFPLPKEYSNAANETNNP